jgi:hypothetical protein
MDEWNIGISGLNVNDATFWVVLYSIIPPFHHSNLSASGYGK